MKKIISFVLVLGLCLGCMVMSSFAIDCKPDYEISVIDSQGTTFLPKTGTSPHQVGYCVEDSWGLWGQQKVFVIRPGDALKVSNQSNSKDARVNLVWSSCPKLTRTELLSEYGFSESSFKDWMRSQEACSGDQRDMLYYSFQDLSELPTPNSAAFFDDAESVQEATVAYGKEYLLSFPGAESGRLYRLNAHTSFDSSDFLYGGDVRNYYIYFDEGATASEYDELAKEIPTYQYDFLTGANRPALMKSKSMDITLVNMLRDDFSGSQYPGITYKKGAVKTYLAKPDTTVTLENTSSIRDAQASIVMSVYRYRTLTDALSYANIPLKDYREFTQYEKVLSLDDLNEQEAAMYKIHQIFPDENSMAFINTDTVSVELPASGMSSRWPGVAAKVVSAGNSGYLKFPNVHDGDICEVTFNNEFDCPIDSDQPYCTEGNSVYFYIDSNIGEVPRFVDVKPSNWFYNSVTWGTRFGITGGTSATTFSPNSTCTNAQILTFMCSAMGGRNVTGNNPFMDVKENAWYYPSGLWAFQNNIIPGGMMNPNKLCTRASAVTYLWALAGRPYVAPTSKFVDVPAAADYSQAVAWALNEGITSGTSSNTFSPDATCTRAQIMTFLYSTLEK